MTNPLKRGEVWLADLNPTQGSEQAGIRPVIIFQNDLVSEFSTTTITIPLSTNQRRAALPICLSIESRIPVQPLHTRNFTVSA
jgi:mRNA interferase MazF